MLNVENLAYACIPIGLHCIPAPAEVARCACISTILIDIHAYLLIGLAMLCLARCNSGFTQALN